MSKLLTAFPPFLHRKVTGDGRIIDIIEHICDCAAVDIMAIRIKLGKSNANVAPRSSYDCPVPH
jgi:hypothetical protein